MVHPNDSVSYVEGLDTHRSFSQVAEFDTFFRLQVLNYESALKNDRRHIQLLI